MYRSGADPPRNSAYQRAAKVRAGAHIYAAPGRAPWARFRTTTTVRQFENDPWIELRVIPGLQSHPYGAPLFHAHVAVEEVIFPSGDED